MGVSALGLQGEHGAFITARSRVTATWSGRGAVAAAGGQGGTRGRNGGGFSADAIENESCYALQLISLN